LGWTLWQKELKTVTTGNSYAQRIAILPKDIL